MSYETSYESGRKPFAPDLERGKWTHTRDFVFAGLALAFRMDIFSTIWFYSSHMGVFAIVPYLLCLVLFAVPLMVIQSFMGQFSSSGFISAFRLAPLFKGMGYVSLAVNLTSLTYYSIFGVIPLFYFFNSMRPVLPWSCEGLTAWIDEMAEHDRVNLCNITTLNGTEEPSYDIDYSQNGSMYSVTYHVPSVLYFARLFGEDYLYMYAGKFVMPWQLLLCNCLVWSVVGFTLWKFFDVALIGKIVRRCTVVCLWLLGICMVRLLLLPGGHYGIIEFLWPDPGDIIEGTIIVPFFVMSAFGIGWGTIIALSSFNKFQANIMKTSWQVGLGQMGIYMAFAATSFMITNHLDYKLPSDESYPININYNWVLFLSSGSVLANTELPQLWCMVYYGMLGVAAFTIIIIQAYSILVSVFDEFESLRAHKPRITIGLVVLMAVTSLYACSSHGFSHYSALTADVLFTQIIMNLLIILVVLWIYGRERFQQDIEFMLGQPFRTWRVYMMRLVAPLCLLFTLTIDMFIVYSEHIYSTVVSILGAVLFIISPWIFVPVYCVYIACQTAGNVRTRLRRICRPTDWYPVEMADRQRYEEATNNPEVTYQLQDVEAFGITNVHDVDDEEEEPTFKAY